MDLQALVDECTDLATSPSYHVTTQGDVLLCCGSTLWRHDGLWRSLGGKLHFYSTVRTMTRRRVECHLGGSHGRGCVGRRAMAASRAPSMEPGARGGGRSAR